MHADEASIAIANGGPKKGTGFGDNREEEKVLN